MSDVKNDPVKVDVESAEADTLKEDDDLVPLSSVPPPHRSFRHRVKAFSDMTGMDIERAAAKTTGSIMGDLSGAATTQSADRRAVSDMAIMLNLKPDVLVATERRRQRQTSDIVTMCGMAVMAQDDLKLAEQVATYGTVTERQAEKEAAVIEEEAEGPPEAGDFEFNHAGLTEVEAAARLLQYGPNELPEKVDPKWLIFLRLMYAPMPIMIWIAIVAELAILNWLDMAILLLIQFANASVSFYETTKAGDAVAALKSSLKPVATCKRDGVWTNMDARKLVPGDTVLLASGSAIPADCRVNSSEIEVDQAALTGESLPVTFYKGDSVKMGSTVVRGEVEGTVEFTGADTFFGKTASLLQETHEVSHLQKMLMRIMYVLVTLSITLCIIYLVFHLAKGVAVKESIGYTVVLLVASIPLAIEIVTTTTLALGSKKLVKHGAIVARLAAIEDLAGMSILCSDKTGTLTLNQMVLQDDTPVYAPGETQETILMYAAMAAKWHEPPRDALDRLTLGSVNMDLLVDYVHEDYMPFDPQTKRTQGTVRNTKTGAMFKTTKGAPHIILRLLSPDDVAVRDQVETDVARLGSLGIRCLAVAKTDSVDGEWKMMGLLTFLDPPRLDTKATIHEAVQYGVDVKMITGDHLLIARNTANQLDMGNRIFTAERLPMLNPETKQKPDKLGEMYGDLCLAANGFAQVYPEHKYLIVECLRELHYTVGMTGDGVNDAPALKRADVGIAVAGATDAARAAADIVLTQEGLGTIIHGIVISREIFQRINNFITYRIAATLQLLFFFFIALFAFRPKDYEPAPGEEWPDFFHMPVLLLMLITVLNDGTLITIAYDNAKANKTPDRWNLPALFLMSSTLGVVSMSSSLLLLYFMLDSWNADGLLSKMGIGGVNYGEVTTGIYLKVSVSDFLTLFSARTGPKYFWQVAPAPALLAGCVFALTLSSLLAILWPQGHLETIMVEGLKADMPLFGFIWFYSLFFFLLQDVLKVQVYKWMNRINFNGISTTGVVVLPDSTKKLIEDLQTALKEEGLHH
jgi:H+-transporting ATPase